MTNLRQAAEMALEALEWSYGGEPIPSKELEAMDAIRQVLDQLPDATKMIDKDFALNVALETLYNFADDESVDGWKAVDAIGVVRKALSELPPVKSYCGGKPNYCEPDLLNQKCCECGRSGGFALYCGWCWSKGDKPVADVNTSEERVPISDKQGHECQELKASGPIGEIIEAHGLIAVSIPEMPPVGTKLYASPPKREWVTLSDDDIKEIVGNWGDTPIRGYTRKLFDEIDLMYRKRNFG